MRNVKLPEKRAESIAVSHPPLSLPLRNDMSADRCCIARNNHTGFYSLPEPSVLSCVPDPMVTLLLDMFDMQQPSELVHVSRRKPPTICRLPHYEFHLKTLVYKSLFQ